MIGSLWNRRLGAALLAVALLAPAAAAAVDPLVLFLLRALRDQIVLSAAQAAFDAATRPEPPRYGHLALPQASTPAAAPEDQRLKAVIDRSFTYLSPVQREQVHAGLMKILSDPQNATLRPQIVESFVHTAEAVRSAQQTLERLSGSQKRALVAQARSEYLKLAPDERQQMLEILRAGHAPLPQDLTEMMVAEFATAPGGSDATPRVK